MDPPTEISIPSTMARVSGIFSVKQLPFPFSLEMEITPPIFSTFRFTTSIPTPLPEYSVTSVFVENPGARRRERISFFVYSSSGLVSMPLALAFARTASGSIPRPSSVTEIITSLPVCSAARTISPCGSFPAAIRSYSVSSIP